MTGVCNRCFDGCKTCTSSSDLKCLSCNDGFYHDNCKHLIYIIDYPQDI